MRIVSLVPSITETLAAWGRDPIACTRFCERPDLVHVGGTKDPDIAAIVDLSPDLVVLDEEENRRDDHDALVDAGVATHVTAVRDVADVGPEMQALAARVGARWDPWRPSAGAPIGGDLVRVVVPIWRRPWMALGAPTYGTSLLAALGCVNVIEPAPPDALAAAAYPEFDPTQLAAAGGVDLVVVPDEPYPFAERHRAELSAMGPVSFVDGKDLLWWGERSRTAPARLAETLRRDLAAGR